jgi:hypothetical protein
MKKTQIQERSCFSLQTVFIKYGNFKSGLYIANSLIIDFKRYLNLFSDSLAYNRAYTVQRNQPTKELPVE